MIFFPILITYFYCLLIGALIFGWRRVPEFKKSKSSANISFSIIVPYRNEAENLPSLLSSFSRLNYPHNLYELILINDNSSDTSEDICRQFKAEYPWLQIQLLDNSRKTESPKKDAISFGIKNSRFEYILTTDADCIVPENWLKIFNNQISDTGAKLVAGSVAYIPSGNRKYFHAFQEMDFLSLQAAGAGGFGLHLPFMCNGANLCYQKFAFFEVNGFSGNDTISSGDDVFLIQKFSEKRFPVAFLKSPEAIVYTKPQPNLEFLISQRIRWAAKAPSYRSRFAKVLGIVVLLMNFWILLGGILYLLQLIDYKIFLLSFFLKFVVDLGLLYHSAKFFRRTTVLRHFFWSSIVYPFFSVYVAVLSLFKGFEWKGRRFIR